MLRPANRLVPPPRSKRLSSLMMRERVPGETRLDSPDHIADCSWELTRACCATARGFGFSDAFPGVEGRMLLFSLSEVTEFLRTAGTVDFLIASVEEEVKLSLPK